MSEEHWEEICEVLGDIQAQILGGLLEAQGIQVWLSQEGGGHSVYALTVGELGTVHILVPAQQSQAAQAILEDYNAGKFEGMSFADETGQALPSVGETPEENLSDDEQAG